MAKLNIMDIVALSKAGFKYAEIKDLMNTEIPEAPQPQPDPEPQPPTEPEPPAPNDTETPAKATGQPVESTEDQKRIAELEKQLADMQKQNQSKDVSGNVPDPQDTINDIVRGFM